eukprot:7375960-Prymnesium_polylepis.1
MVVPTTATATAPATPAATPAATKAATPAVTKAGTPRTADSPTMVKASAPELSLKEKSTKIIFELSLDPTTGIKETLRQANEYFGIQPEGTPNEQASALLKEMGLC